MHLPRHNGAGNCDRSAEKGNQRRVFCGAAAEQACGTQQEGTADGNQRRKENAPECADDDFLQHGGGGGKAELSAQNQQRKGGRNGRQLVDGQVEKPEISADGEHHPAQIFLLHGADEQAHSPQRNAVNERIFGDIPENGLHTDLFTVIHENRQGDDGKGIQDGNGKSGDDGSYAHSRVAAQGAGQGNADDGGVAAENALQNDPFALRNTGGKIDSGQADEEQNHQHTAAVDHQIPGNCRQILNLIDVHKKQAGQKHPEDQGVALFDEALRKEAPGFQQEAQKNHQYNGNDCIDGGLKNVQKLHIISPLNALPGSCRECCSCSAPDESALRCGHG